MLTILTYFTHYSIGVLWNYDTDVKNSYWELKKIQFKLWKMYCITF